MTPTQAIWRASLRCTFNTLRVDRLRRVGAIAALLVQVVLALWILHRLIPLFVQWQLQGDASLHIHLWLMCLLAWAAIKPCSWRFCQSSRQFVYVRSMARFSGKVQATGCCERPALLAWPWAWYSTGLLCLGWDC